MYDGLVWINARFPCCVLEAQSPVVPNGVSLSLFLFLSPCLSPQFSLIQRIHWSIGFAYMIFFASFVGWVREVVRPGVLWFFRDPSDPNFNPLKDIVDVRTHIFF